MSLSACLPLSRAPESKSFVLEPESHVYVRRSAGAYTHSEGEEVERRIYDILACAKDLSTQSRELQAAIVDWPTEYHLSPARHNLLRHVSVSRDHDVLELGAGCGSTTRLFGESGARVVALEPSLPRARCARMRCRDLDNVEVYCSDFQDFDTERLFDVVSLIGVLPYAPLYIRGDDPLLAMVGLARRYLKPGGVLLVAIDNQLGLKYFCGYPEERLNEPYVGLKDLYTTDTARTLGRTELKELLERAGFPHVDLQYPFPDYKLPSMVFFDRAFETPQFRPDEIIRQMRSRDYTGMHRRSVQEHLVWPVIGRNGLTREFSNSFLAVATLQAGSPMTAPPDLLAVGYTNSRGRGYNTVKRFIVDDARCIWVTRKLSDPTDGQKVDIPGQAGTPLLVHDLSPEQYVQGKLLACEIERAIALDDWPAFLARYKGWIAFLYSHRVKDGSNGNILEAELPPEYADCVPQNMIVAAEDLQYIDREWQLHGKILVGALVLRTVMSFYTDPDAKAFLMQHLHADAPHHILYLLTRHLELQVTPEVVDNYVYVNNTISELVFPEKPPIALADAMTWFREQINPSGPHLAPSPLTDERPLTPWYGAAYSALVRSMRRFAHELMRSVRRPRA